MPDKDLYITYTDTDTDTQTGHMWRGKEGNSTLHDPVLLVQHCLSAMKSRVQLLVAGPCSPFHPPHASHAPYSARPRTVKHPPNVKQREHTVHAHAHLLPPSRSEVLAARERRFSCPSKVSQSRSWFMALVPIMAALRSP